MILTKNTQLAYMFAKISALFFFPLLLLSSCSTQPATKKFRIGFSQCEGDVVEIFGLYGAKPFIDRHKGFVDIISKQPGITLLTTLEDNTPGYEKKLTATLLGEKNIDLIFCQSDFVARRAYKIYKQTG